MTARKSRRVNALELRALQEMREEAERQYAKGLIDIEALSRARQEQKDRLTKIGLFRPCRA